MRQAYLFSTASPTLEEKCCRHVKLIILLVLEILVKMSAKNHQLAVARVCLKDKKSLMHQT